MTVRRREGYRWTMLAEDHRSVAFGHEADRWAAPEADVAFGLDTDLEDSPHDLEDNFANLLALCFADGRQFASLNFAEEHAVWFHIESAQNLTRRGLYTAPIEL